LPSDDMLNVSASEAAKGGIKYEVILEAENPLVTPPSVTTPKPYVSAEAIKLKLDAAAERRQSLESERIASLAEKTKKIEEAAAKRAEEEKNFISTTKEIYEKKMENHIGNRENIITDLKVKLSNHNTSHLQEVRQNLESSVSEFEEKAKEDLEKKLVVAEQNRDKVIKERLESLKKHEEKVEMVRSIKRSGSQGLSEDGTSDAAQSTSE